MLGFISGFVIGSLDWLLIYCLYRIMIFRNSENYSKKEKAAVSLLLVIKMLLVFAALFVVIRVLRFNVISLILGLTLSLIGMIIIMLKKNK
ncbi:MAG: hypothetical protein JXA66_05170 [Oligoflexia bacterium]|nr:hypothetical protein [Oligoflexia bacterium]